METLNIEKIKQLVNDGKLRWTNHIAMRLLQRKINQEDVLGLNKSNEYIHVVCGSNGMELWLITAYYPNQAEWEDDLKTRKENNENE